ncbi:hypothetical protein J25TS5_51790 [Paenibacillus faecis]|uniref:hypothetical protein n=1 Tax=Paenibacillus faecis TaxID=862114 RepID=UPI001B2E6C37|nr:hypothetical protein [Paenibacillus faecis]GIO88247.1 hypothetical protein J25TS5_51790 [Paenibacillus faecis]
MPTTLPQPYALRLEMIRAAGYSNQEAISLIENKDTATLVQNVNPEVNWGEFLDYAHQNREDIRAAIAQGYRFKFITAGGLQSFLRISFGLQAGEDYRFDGERFTEIGLSEPDFELLRHRVPEQHWTFVISERDEGSGEVRFEIELASAAY